MPTGIEKALLREQAVAGGYKKKRVSWVSRSRHAEGAGRKNEKEEGLDIGRFLNFGPHLRCDRKEKTTKRL